MNPIFEIGPMEPRFSEWLVFEVKQPPACSLLECSFSRHYPHLTAYSPPALSPSSVGCVAQGISVDETGKQHFLDATVAYKRAVSSVSSSSPCCS